MQRYILIFTIFSFLTLQCLSEENTPYPTKEDVKVILVDENDKIIPQKDQSEETPEIYIKEDSYDPHEEDFLIEEDPTKKIDVEIKINGDIKGLYDHNAKKYNVKVKVNKGEPKFYEEEKKEGILVRLVKNAIRYTGF